jgi:hypothetical protein
MSAANPRKDLEKVIALSDSGHLPVDARRWAEKAAHTADEILATVRTMKKNGRDLPTEAQREALGNIYAAAQRWLRTVKDNKAGGSLPVRT